MGLFDALNRPPSSESELQPGEDVGEARYDKDISEETKARIEDLVAFNSDLIRPQRVNWDTKNGSQASPFHELISKDFKISKITEGDVAIIRLYQSTIDHYVFIGLKGMATVLHAELIGFLAAKSSVNGFEREALISTLTKIYKDTKQSSPQPRRLI